MKTNRVATITALLGHHPLAIMAAVVTARHDPKLLTLHQIAILAEAADKSLEILEANIEEESL